LKKLGNCILSLFFNFSKSDSMFMRLCGRIFQDEVIRFHPGNVFFPMSGFFAGLFSRRNGIFKQDVK